MEKVRQRMGKGQDMDKYCGTRGNNLASGDNHTAKASKALGKKHTGKLIHPQ